MSLTEYGVAINTVTTISLEMNLGMSDSGVFYCKHPGGCFSDLRQQI